MAAAEQRVMVLRVALCAILLASCGGAPSASETEACVHLRCDRTNGEWICYVPCGHACLASDAPHTDDVCPAGL